MWWHFIDQVFLGQTANLIQPFLLVYEVGGSKPYALTLFNTSMTHVNQAKLKHKNVETIIRINIIHSAPH